MQKKFDALNNKITEQDDLIRRYEEKEQQRHERILKLENEKQMLRADIVAKDATIKEREEEINELKKLNQELDKFKFVLDFQIKELKSEIEPREETIAKMKSQVSGMDLDLETFHRENGNLAQEVKNLKELLDKKQAQIKNDRQHYRRLLTHLNTMKSELYQVVQHIQDPPQLRRDVSRLYRTFVNQKIQSVAVAPEVSKEYKRQKQHLEKTVHALKTKLARDVQSRKNDNMRIMQENVALIKEINTMRRDLKLMHQVQRQKELNTASEAERHVQTVDPNWDEKEAQRVIDMQRAQVEELRTEIEMWQQRVVNQRPISRERHGYGARG